MTAKLDTQALYKLLTKINSAVEDLQECIFMDDELTIPYNEAQMGLEAALQMVAPHAPAGSTKDGK